jgi:hypothetical protein
MKRRSPWKGAQDTTAPRAVSSSLAHGVLCPHSQDCRRIALLGDERAGCLHCGQILNRSDLLELFTGAMP